MKILTDKKLNAKSVAASVAIMCTTLAVPAHAEVKLNVQENIKVTAINDKAVNTSFFRSPKMNYTLTAGKHVITARYDRFYETGRDEHDYLKSDKISLVVDLADNQTYTLVMLNQPEKYEEAKKYVDNPTLAVKSGDKIIASEQLAVDENTGVFNSISNRLFGKTQSTTFITPTAQGKTGTAIDALNSSAVQENKSALDKFMQIWLEATPEEREKIRSWVSQ